MKRIICITATAALLLIASVSHARGTPTSSFAPRGPEPHSSLSDKHHSIKSKHSGSQGAARKGGHNATPKTGHPTGHNATPKTDHTTGHTPHSD
jgi:hypothetical protein